MERHARAVEAEARTRLHFVMPGETPYVVQLPGNTPAPAGTTHGAKKPSYLIGRIRAQFQ